MAYRVMPRGQNLTYYLMKAVEANTAARDSERAEELRQELIATALGSLVLDELLTEQFAVERYLRGITITAGEPLAEQPQYQLCDR